MLPSYSLTSVIKLFSLRKLLLTGYFVSQTILRKHYDVYTRKSADSARKAPKTKPFSKSRKSTYLHVDALFELEHIDLTISTSLNVSRCCCGIG